MIVAVTANVIVLYFITNTIQNEIENEIAIATTLSIANVTQMQHTLQY